MIKQQFIQTCNGTTSLKFDGRLNPTVGSATEIGKERFLSLLRWPVEVHGHKTFHCAKDLNGSMFSVLEHLHSFTLEMIIDEFDWHINFENILFEACNAYEIQDTTLSHLIVELLLTSDFHDKIFICYGHCNDFSDLPGSALLLMALETCNASVSHDIDGATTLFNELSLDS